MSANIVSSHTYRHKYGLLVYHPKLGSEVFILDWNENLIVSILWLPYHLDEPIINLLTAQYLESCCIKFEIYEGNCNLLT